MDFMNLTSGGNGQDFGDIHSAIGYSAGLMSSTRGLIAGGVFCMHYIYLY